MTSSPWAPPRVRRSTLTPASRSKAAAVAAEHVCSRSAGRWVIAVVGAESVVDVVGIGITEHDVAVQTVRSNTVIEKDVALDVKVAKYVTERTEPLEALTIVLKHDAVADGLDGLAGAVTNIDARAVAAVGGVPTGVVGDQPVDLKPGRL